jgi:GT2 family glycosyltransferase
MQILTVIVLYKRRLEESQAILGLTQAFKSRPELRDSIGLLVWDNSPVPLEQRELPFSFQYRHSSQNAGVSGAYNKALEIAEELSCPWMLLLDHDTALSGHYLDQMLSYSRELEPNEEIAAIAPFLLHGERAISPQIIRFYGMMFMLPPFSGVYPKEAFAMNSGTLMRVAALKEIGGYDEDFWLDHSDIVVFHHLYRRNKRLYVAGDLQLPHLVSLTDYDALMSAERYRNFISAETAYYDLYRPRWQNAIQTLRLFVRVIRQYLRFRNKEYSKITWEYLRERILLTKAQRLMRWKQQLTQRNLPAVAGGRAAG